MGGRLNMNGRQISHLATKLKLWLVFVSLHVTFGNLKVAAANRQQAERRELGIENPGFISIDCGATANYYDDNRGVYYKTDSEFIDVGVNHEVSTGALANIKWQQLTNLRSFPNGTKNCYALKPEQGKNNKYLLRAMFWYGNYDGLNRVPAFDLYVGVNLWGNVKEDTAVLEIIFVSPTDSISVCLVNTGFGIPYISVLELRLLNNTIYQSESGALVTIQRRFHLENSTTNSMNRFKDDVYDRIWMSYSPPADWVTFSTTSAIDVQSSNDSYKLPVKVLTSAARPKSNLSSLNYSLSSSSYSISLSTYNYTYSYSSYEFYVYFHFAEIAQSQQREFTITLNGINYGPFRLEYLKPLTITPLKSPIRGDVRFSINSTMQSDLPPILNAFEILMVYPFLNSSTNPADVEAIMAIKQIYKIGSIDWQGDPCVPRELSWNGLNCSSGNNPPRITSLNLSSSRLTGEIASSFANFRALQSLDLSYNDLTGTVPEFLGQLPNLTILSLIGNKFSGSIPQSLMDKSNSGLLQLRFDKNPTLCKADSCETKKKRYLLPIIAPTASILVLLIIIATVFWRTKRKGVEKVSKSRKESSLKSKNQRFTYSEIVSITNNFRTIIGGGGFGEVYLGNLKDGTQVAVKLLSQSSKQGYKEFQAEAQLLVMVYHRNLVSLVGYCEENENMALVYEYMANGNLRQHLSGTGTKVLNWRERLQIAVDAAHGLEYLHNGCKPPIIHRDLKPSNILLNGNLQAKIADFGLSKVFSTERDSDLTSRPAGTLGYFDPEFYASGSLNKKSDVFSFGVILFELITGLPAIIRGDADSTHITQWVSPIIETGDIQGTVDPRLEGEFNTNSAWKAVEVAMSCVQIAIKRPDMSHVLAELKECLDLELPSGRIEREQTSMISLNNSLELSSPDLDSEIAPTAR